MRGIRWPVVAVLWGMAACAAEAPDPAPPTLEALETILADPATTVDIPFQVDATGAMEVGLSGRLALAGEGMALLEVRGTFGGQPLDARLVSDGSRLWWTGAGEAVPTPPGLREALALGFTRMGVLHNVARLSAGAAPDHAEGGVAEWVTTAPDTAGSAPEPRRDRPSLARAVVVSGVPTGSFRLAFLPEGSVPVERRQAVSFPTGVMQVEERYPGVSVDAVLPDSLFRLPATPPP